MFSRQTFIYTVDRIFQTTCTFVSVANPSKNGYEFPIARTLYAFCANNAQKHANAHYTSHVWQCVNSSLLEEEWLTQSCETRRAVSWGLASWSAHEHEMFLIAWEMSTTQGCQQAEIVMIESSGGKCTDLHTVTTQPVHHWHSNRVSQSSVFHSFLSSCHLFPSIYFPFPFFLLFTFCFIRFIHLALGTIFTLVALGTWNLITVNLLVSQNTWTVLTY